MKNPKISLQIYSPGFPDRQNINLDKENLPSDFSSASRGGNSVNLLVEFKLLIFED